MLHEPWDRLEPEGRGLERLDLRNGFADVPQTVKVDHRLPGVKERLVALVGVRQVGQKHPDERELGRRLRRKIFAVLLVTPLRREQRVPLFDLFVGSSRHRVPNWLEPMDGRYCEHGDHRHQPARVADAEKRLGHFDHERDGFRGFLCRVLLKDVSRTPVGYLCRDFNVLFEIISVPHDVNSICRNHAMNA